MKKIQKNNNKQLELFTPLESLNEIEDDYIRFIPFKRIFIHNTPKDIDSECHFKDNIWSFPVNGKVAYLYWDNFSITKQLIELFKSFLYVRLQNKSTSTVLRDFSLLRVIDTISGLLELPWETKSISELLNTIQREQYYTIKYFYEWCLKRSVNGFVENDFKFICEFKFEKKIMYKKVFLRQLVHISEKVSLVSKILEQDESLFNIPDSFDSFQQKVLIRLCLELAPRPSQIYFINMDDFKAHTGKASTYYSINLPMAKKVSEKVKEQRVRSISPVLGSEIEKLINWTETKFGSQELGLFVHPNTGKRYSANQIAICIQKSLEFVNLNATELRHNLAQSLADQGASADVIADILGHNSTLPARSYLAATPKISEIKSKALGKNNNYKNIMHMLNTGAIINKNDIQKETWVKGLVGYQYIGEIGACGLGAPCPKNPVYSCYTCKMFNPFNDGKHEDVLKGLEGSVQLFLDASTNKKDIQHNRTVVQLESTIVAVKDVINLIKSKNTEE